MASITPKVLYPAQYLGASVATLYSPTNARAIIDQAIATNTGTTNQTITMHIGSGAVSGSNMLVKARAIAPGETYQCFELIGQVLENNETLSGGASAATQIVFRVAGREIT